MFFEIFENRSDVVSGMGEQTFSYGTYLARNQTPESLITLQLSGMDNLEEAMLGDVSILLTQNNLHVRRFFPFGEKIEQWGVHVNFEDRPWRSVLLGKRIAGTVESLLLKQFTQRNISVRIDGLAGLSQLRADQLRKYGIFDGQDLDSYLASLDIPNTLEHFEVTKFPPWVTNS